MSERFKMPKDKRQRSASSVGSVLQETRSDRKFDLRGIRGSIPEIDDKFSVAEARCDVLREKIDLVRALKHKRKFKKRSTTFLAEHPQSSKDEIPLTAVRAQTKKEHSGTTRRRNAGSRNSKRCYDPATQEQYRMLEEMRVCSHECGPVPLHALKTKAVSNVDLNPNPAPPRRRRSRNSRADGDSARSSTVAVPAMPQGRYVEDFTVASDITERGERRHTENSKYQDMKRGMHNDSSRRRRNQHERLARMFDSTSWIEEKNDGECKQAAIANKYRVRRGHRKLSDEKPVVELYNKESTAERPGDCIRRATCKSSIADRPPWKDIESEQIFPEKDVQPIENISNSETKAFKYGPRHSTQRERRVRYRTRRYEYPTFASQMKQAGIRCTRSTSRTNIPFVVSQSTSPSHNIGLNIQQVLNGIKMQQPLSGIPITIAHHMGLRHIPFWIGPASKEMEPELDNRQINVIKLGTRLLRLPSYKFISYNRLLRLYREGEGVVPRFLRAISRPHYSYTSIVPTNKENQDGLKVEDPKQSLAAYAALYREYERVSRCIQEGNCDPEMLRRKEELSRELTLREGHIRKLVHEYRTPLDGSTPLRNCASTNDDVYRRSNYKFQTAVE